MKCKNMEKIITKLYKLSSRSTVKKYCIDIMPVEGSKCYGSVWADPMLNFSKEDMDQAMKLVDVLPDNDFIVLITAAKKSLNLISGEWEY